MALRVGLVVNPIAGMGGKVALKGTDHARDEALARGAEPVAPVRARAFLARLQELLDSAALADPPAWVTAAGPLGEDLLREAGFEDLQVVHAPRDPARTTAEDTRAAARAMAGERLDVLLFVGGDGTARDVVGAAPGVPVLGVPSGVKMHSAVFALTPEAAADVVAEHAQGLTRVVEAEVLDVDEEAYRRGDWKVRLFAMARTLDEPTLRQVGKMAFDEVSEADLLDDLAAHLEAHAKQHPQALFLLGPGSTVAHAAGRLGVEKTLLGFDAWRAGDPVGRDLDERGLLALLDPGTGAAPDAFLVLSPIGAQGFVLGRGNQQASPEVVRRVLARGWDRLLVLATPGKLRATPALHVDTGDEALDRMVRARGYLPVVVGYRTSRLVPVA